MSVDFWTKPRLRIEELFDGRLEGWGIFEPRGNKRLSDVRCLADGGNYVRVFSCSADLVIASYGFNDPYRILKSISEAFDVEIWLEVDLQLGQHKRVIKRPTSNRAARSSGVRGSTNRALYKL